MTQDSGNAPRGQRAQETFGLNAAAYAASPVHMHDDRIEIMMRMARELPAGSRTCVTSGSAVERGRSRRCGWGRRPSRARAGEAFGWEREQADGPRRPAAGVSTRRFRRRIVAVWECGGGALTFSGGLLLKGDRRRHRTARARSRKSSRSRLDARREDPHQRWNVPLGVEERRAADSMELNTARNRDCDGYACG